MCKSWRVPSLAHELHVLVALMDRRAETLLFSGSHFHRTLPQATGRARFSLDFRAVDLDDHARGAGAPNVDNRSRGSALVDYTMPLR